MENISFEEFLKVQIKIGRILVAERIEGSDKLLRLEVDFGPTLPEGSAGQASGDNGDPDSASLEPVRIVRQILAGIAQYYNPEDLVGKECPFVFNLASKKLKGLESQGMILCPSGQNGPCLLHPDKEVPAGAQIK